MEEISILRLFLMGLFFGLGIWSARHILEKAPFWVVVIFTFISATKKQEEGFSMELLNNYIEKMIYESNFEEVRWLKDLIKENPDLPEQELWETHLSPLYILAHLPNPQEKGLKLSIKKQPYGRFPWEKN